MKNIQTAIRAGKMIHKPLSTTKINMLSMYYQVKSAVFDGFSILISTDLSNL